MDREVQGQVRHGRNDLRDPIFAIQKKRPDLYLTILVIANLADRWRNVPEVDEIVEIKECTDVFGVARESRNRFDVAILFANSIRVGIEAWLAGIPRRVGYSRPLRDFFVNQFVREQSRSLTNQRNDYLRIAECIGADIVEQLPDLPRGDSIAENNRSVSEQGVR